MLADILRRQAPRDGDRCTVGHYFACDFALSSTSTLRCPLRDYITDTVVDPVENQFLLTTSMDGSVIVHDLLAPRSRLDGLIHEVASVQGAHKDGVRCASWFGLDTGMFATGGGDAVVTVWDTNAMARACSFDVEDAVYDVQFHPWAASHALVASAGGSTVVRMCDLRSGSSVHMLSGHRARATCLAWSPVNEYLLSSGDADGGIRIWDVRKSGSAACVAVVNGDGQSRSRRDVQEREERRAAAATQAAMQRAAPGPSSPAEHMERPPTDGANAIGGEWPPVASMELRRRRHTPAPARDPASTTGVDPATASRLRLRQRATALAQQVRAERAERAEMRRLGLRPGAQGPVSRKAAFRRARWETVKRRRERRQQQQQQRQPVAGADGSAARSSVDAHILGSLDSRREREVRLAQEADSLLDAHRAYLRRRKRAAAPREGEPPQKQARPPPAIRPSPQESARRSRAAPRTQGRPTAPRAPAAGAGAASTPPRTLPLGLCADAPPGTRGSIPAAGRGPHRGPAEAVTGAHRSAVVALAWTPSGAHLLSHGSSGQLRVWESAGLDPLTVNFPRLRPVGSTAKRRIAVLPADGPLRERVAVPAGNGGDVGLYDVFSGRRTELLRAHHSTVAAASYSPRTRELYTGGQDGVLVAWVPKRMAAWRGAARTTFRHQAPESSAASRAASRVASVLDNRGVAGAGGAAQTNLAGAAGVWEVGSSSEDEEAEAEQQGGGRGRRESRLLSIFRRQDSA